MPVPASILVYGRDPSLLHTRTMLLKRLGHAVSTALTQEDFERAARKQQVDLLVLCHSLSRQECEDAIALTHSCWPGSTILALTAGDAGCRSTEAETFVALDGPDRLLQAVEAIIHRRTP